MLLRYLKSFINLFRHSRFEVYLIFQSLFYLLFIKYKLYRQSFNDLAKQYDLELLKDEKTFKNIDLGTIKTIGWAVERASLLLPWDGLCLVKALAAQRILVNYKFSAVIFMGVKRDDKSKNLEAHAWLKCNNIFLTGRAGHKKFTVVSRLTWTTYE